MKRKNIEIMERAIGVLDGLSFVAEEKIGEALVCALEMLESVLKDEKERK